ncbi:hypothetical protein KL86DES1_20464 [uncultured Desulfovibrio sp.]|uniref:Uncharacterized protein n=1 Tax=uncultured Desulfovibrio sp. TaxID=167968 RepID=A0A212L3U3_9BACT|nr:hypothetical protein KL86DES1_20464 [uncultured Desulfovibrio sp.]VZH33367.1 conserved protein of unknown function [Desulfovibrio sp. 86]
MLLLHFIRPFSAKRPELAYDMPCRRASAFPGAHPGGFESRDPLAYCLPYAALYSKFLLLRPQAATCAADGTALQRGLRRTACKR